MGSILAIKAYGADSRAPALTQKLGVVAAPATPAVRGGNSCVLTLPPCPAGALGS